MKKLFLLFALSCVTTAFGATKIECRHYKYQGDQGLTSTKPFLVTAIPGLDLPKSAPELFKPVGPMKIRAKINGKLKDGLIKIDGYEFMSHGNLFINLGMKLIFNDLTVEVFEDDILEDEHGVEHWIWNDHRSTACVITK